MAAVTTGMENALEHQGEKPSKAKPRKLPVVKGKPLFPPTKEGTVPAKEAQNHASIERDIHMRFWAEKMLAGRTLTVEGSQIRISPPLNLQGPEAPPWTAPNVATLEYVEMLTATEKMGAPSFAIPVGPLDFGGSCPGSVAGMTTSPRGAYERQKKRVLQVLRATNPGLPVPHDYRPSEAVCSSCYVTGGNHGYLLNTALMVARYAWTRAAVLGGFFVPTMINIIRAASYPAEPAGIGLNQRYFRIHDAGDFYHPKYLQAWHDIAAAFTGSTDGNPRTVFWAPTRIWATEWGDGAMRAINGGANFLENFVVRPSAYIIDAPGPEYPIGPASGYAAPTVVARKPMIDAVLDGRVRAVFDWSCPAQALGDGACLSSPNPMGGTGCRVCWIAPSWRTAYGLH